MGPRARKDVDPLQRMNHEIALAALRRGRGCASHRPVHVYLQIASGCNLDCYMCSEHNRPEWKKHGRGLISFSRVLFDKLALEVFPYSQKLMLGVGGEPTISSAFVDYVEKAREAGQEVQLLTNGTRLGNERIAKAVARCVSTLQISLDAATKETYERIRIGARWNSMRANLELLNRFRLQDAPEERTHLSLCFVLMKSNVHELPAFIDMAKELHADRVHAQHVIGVTDEGRAETLAGDPERFAHFRGLALERARELGIELDVPGPYTRTSSAPSTAPNGSPVNGVHTNGVHVNGVHVNGAHLNGSQTAPAGGEPAPLDDPLARHCVRCVSPTIEVFIFFDGRVFPCCHPFAHQKMQVGDLRRQSFDEIWNGRLYRNLRAGLRSGDVPSICKNCSIVHDPPPAYEDPEAMQRGPDLATWYGERDLDPLQRDRGLVERMASAGVLDYVRELDRHSRSLESERRGLGAHAQNLERDSEGMKRHIENLERELALLRSSA